MHSTFIKDEENNQEVVFIHDGDYGGTIFINANISNEISDEMISEGRAQIKISGKALFEFFARKIIDDKISEVESLSVEDVLKEIW